MTLADVFERADLPAVQVAGVTADSRAVRPGMVFAALAGTRVDGTAFIADAVARGAVAVLARDGTHWPGDVPMVLDAEPRRALARAAVRLAGPMPERIIAVTGTNGKTSTVSFTTQILRASGIAAASIGTLGIDAPGFDAGGSLTTPDPVALAATLAALARAGVGTVALEASSHGLAQYRLDGVSPAVGAFTNLTRDHLDFHATMDGYRAAKLRLFSELLPAGAPAVVNVDADAPIVAAIRSCRPRVLSVGRAGEDVCLLELRPIADGLALRLRAFGTVHETALPLIGAFQADNALLAATVVSVLGGDGFAHLAALRGARGRMERVAPGVFVDYAHTPDAISRAIEALRPHTPGRLSIVFGAGGDRDSGKRAPMGRAAAQADRVYVTDDNSRSERPEAIRAQVRQGCPGAIEIGDRRAAIGTALSDLRAGDTLLIAGKGHETGQTVGGVTQPFDDAAVVRELVCA